MSEQRTVKRVMWEWERIDMQRQKIKLHHADTEPLTVARIEDIASTLELSRNCPDPVQEITYRRALREALNILNYGEPCRNEVPLEPRTWKPSAQEEAQADPRARESQASAGGALTSPPARQGEGKHCRSCTRAPHEHEPSTSRQQGRCNSEGPAGQHRNLSKAKAPDTPEREHQPLPSPGAGRKSLPRSKEARIPHRIKGKPAGESRSPSPASKHLARTSTPDRNPHRRRTQGALEGQTPAALSQWQQNLPGGPAECPSEPGTELQEEGESPPRKRSRVCDGEADSEGPGSGQKRRSSGLAESLDPESSPKGSLWEHKEVAEQEGEPSQCSEDEEEFVSARNLSPKLSPAQEICSSPILGDDEEEEEELPSFLLNQRPCSIRPSMLVWCKLPRQPYWPAVVKRVERKSKKASVVLIEKDVDDKSKGFSVCLRSLKHFDCEEKQKLIDKAAETYSCEINWCIRLIADYRIRVGCHSFTGSLLEYCADDMSYPVRKEASKHPSPLTFPQALEAAPKEPPKEAPRHQVAKKVLPDRMRAARDKANKRLVDFIVKTRGADAHLQSILGNTKPSRWLQKFLHSQSSVLTCIETYLEDDSQQELVVDYLQEVYQAAGASAPPLSNGSAPNFILEVLFPEAIIYAISAVDQIDYKTAEEKYIRGPQVTEREKQNFEETLREEKKKRR
ncbi:PWWP domain-containing DNA repair factor 3A [Varanus komodoensis]|nr:PWWP domain-containing DNA repair factor 3A [Varanus komodoensis]